MASSSRNIDLDSVVQPKFDFEAPPDSVTEPGFDVCVCDAPPQCVSTPVTGRTQYITCRRIRNLNRSEESDLLYKNKLTQEILSTPNVVSMSYTHEVRNGERTGRKVLQVGVIKKLKEDEIQHPDIFIPKKIELDNDLVVPVQVVAEGNLKLHGQYNGCSTEHQKT